MSVFDPFEQIQNSTVGNPSTVILFSGNSRWYPGTIGKSTRTLSVNNLDATINSIVIAKNTSPIFGVIITLIYDYVANGGNTVDLSNQIINIAASPSTTAKLTLSDSNNSQTITLTQNFGPTPPYRFDTRQFTNISTTNITMMKVETTFSLASSGINAKIYYITSSYINPTGGNDIINNLSKCNY